MQERDGSDETNFQKRIEKVVQHMLPRDLLHDLRTPLGHILGYSELLIEQMQAAGNEEYIPYSRKSGKRVRSSSR